MADGFGPRDEGSSFQGFGAHTRTIQARHMVRSLLSETSLTGSIGMTLN